MSFSRRLCNGMLCRSFGTCSGPLAAYQDGKTAVVLPPAVFLQVRRLLGPYSCQRTRSKRFLIRTCMVLALVWMVTGKRAERVLVVRTVWWEIAPKTHCTLALSNSLSRRRKRNVVFFIVKIIASMKIRPQGASSELLIRIQQDLS